MDSASSFANVGQLATSRVNAHIAVATTSSSDIEVAAFKECGERARHTSFKTEIILCRCGRTVNGPRAIIPIIKASGGIITTWDNKPPGTNDTVIACNDKKMHKILVNNLQNYL